MNPQHTELKTVLINGVECLFTDTREQSIAMKTSSKYPYKYDLRYGDDNEPWSIEKSVTVNYYGTILASESFLKHGRKSADGRKYRDIDACECGCGYPAFIEIGALQC